MLLLFCSGSCWNQFTTGVWSGGWSWSGTTHLYTYGATQLNPSRSWPSCRRSGIVCVCVCVYMCVCVFVCECMWEGVGYVFMLPVLLCVCLVSPTCLLSSEHCWSWKQKLKVVCVWYGMSYMCVRTAALNESLWVKWNQENLILVFIFSLDTPNQWFQGRQKGTEGCKYDAKGGREGEGLDIYSIFYYCTRLVNFVILLSCR